MPVAAQRIGIGGDVPGRFGVPSSAVLPGELVGLARDVRTGLMPINGLRHPPAGPTSGWYLWAGGELSTRDDYFEPCHIVHLATTCPAVMPYLLLPPGWRFLIAPNVEDVWFDDTLLAPS